MPIPNPKLEAFLTDAPIFLQPWWLEAVSPGAWDYAVVQRGEEVAAVLPYTFKTRLGGLRLIEMPPLTPYLGPWLRASTAKYANRLGEQKDLMTELIDALPQFAVFQQEFHPAITNWLPFHWKGFGQTTRYTYRMDRTKDLDALWSETRDNVRTDIKKAKKVVEVAETDDIEKFLRLHRLTFNRQNYPYPYDEHLIKRLDEACATRHSRCILIARDGEGNLHAGGYFIWDRRTMYYLMGGADPELRTSGAAALVIWKAIERASENQLSFDFEGSMVEPIERFVRAFGAVQTPYFGIQKSNSWALSAFRQLRSAFR